MERCEEQDVCEEQQVIERSRTLTLNLCKEENVVKGLEDLYAWLMDDGYDGASDAAHLLECVDHLYTCTNIHKE
jgi:hypothetical protein